MLPGAPVAGFSEPGGAAHAHTVLPSATHRRTDREAFAGRQQARTVEVQRLLTHSLKQAVDLSLIGQKTLQIDCDVINADGGSRATALNGAWVALALALRKHGL
ncbi:MAG TPA: ribonuclease PH, partial [Mycobacterium sp.]|nr:ribonuclease PH [Mycobacterium sp.]